MLRKTERGWEFASESELENYVWAHLEELFSLVPLARQYVVNGEVCDILAAGDRQLHILELKNNEDRYLVQQLTRYYDHLLEAQPLADRLNYSRPMRLVAIAPTFHRHNFIDRKYLTLPVQFWQFEIEQQHGLTWLHIWDVDTGEEWRRQLPHSDQPLSGESEMPQRLRNMLKLHYWLATTYAGKLDMPSLKDADYRKYGWKSAPKVTSGKTFRICIPTGEQKQYKKDRIVNDWDSHARASLKPGIYRCVSLRVPSGIPQFMVRAWVRDNVPEAAKMEADTGRTIWERHGASPRPWTMERLEHWRADGCDDCEM